MNIEDKESERKRALAKSLYTKTINKSLKEQTCKYKALMWLKHPILSFRKWLLLTFPNIFNLGE